MGSAAQAIVIPKNEKFRNIETVQKPATAQVTRTVLPITEVMRKLVLTLTGTLTEGGIADGTLTPEGILSLIRSITVEATSSSRREVGKIKSADFASMFILQNFLRGTPPDRLVPTPIIKSSAATPFRVQLPIDFEMPFSQDPRQTLLNTTELTSLSLLTEWGDASDIFSTGTWTFPTCSLRVSSSEFVDSGMKANRYGLNQLSFLEYVTTSTNSRLAIDLKRGYLLRGLLIKQFTRSGVYYHTPVETVINQVSLELNREVKKTYTFKELQGQNKEQFQMASVPTGYAFLDLMPEGRFDTVVDTREYRDVYVILDVTGVANSLVRVYPVEIIPSTL